MKVNSIFVSGFRNLQAQEVSFESGWNLLLGDNAQGKTNLVEAVDMFRFGSSFRTRQSSCLVKHKESQARLRMNFSRDDDENIHTIDLFRQGSSKFLKDGKKVRRSEIIGRFQSVLFSPDDLFLSKGEPDVRRRYVDMVISQLYTPYYRALCDYKKGISQRNRLLKIARENNSDPELETMDAWENQIALSADYIVRQRERIIKEISGYLKSYFEEICEGRKAELRYTPSWNRVEKPNLVSVLKENRYKDTAAGFTTSGPHRDSVWLQIDGKPAKNYGSQGQHRLLSVALKLAEIRLIEDITGTRPVMILDDIFSELDRDKARALASAMPDDLQVLATSTGMGLPDGIMERSRCLKVAEGVVK